MFRHRKRGARQKFLRLCSVKPFNGRSFVRRLLADRRKRHGRPKRPETSSDRKTLPDASASGSGGSGAVRIANARCKLQKISATEQRRRTEQLSFRRSLLPMRRLPSGCRWVIGTRESPLPSRVVRVRQQYCDLRMSHELRPTLPFHVLSGLGRNRLIEAPLRMRPTEETAFDVMSSRVKSGSWRGIGSVTMFICTRPQYC